MKHKYVIIIECTCGYRTTIEEEKEGPGGPEDVDDVGHRVLPPREGRLGKIGLEDRDFVTITHNCSCGFEATTINGCPGTAKCYSHLDNGELPNEELFKNTCDHIGTELDCHLRQPSTFEGKDCFFQYENICGNRLYGWIVGGWLE